MFDVFTLLWSALTSSLRSRVRLEAEILTLRQQINVLRRNSPKRFAFGALDRLVFVGLYRLVPGIVEALAIVRPETVVRWHRAGFRSFWRWKSRRRGGRPKVPVEVRQLIRTMSMANPLWGAPRIHGELLKLGIDVGQTSVAKYMTRRRRGPSQGWRPFFAITPRASPRLTCSSCRHFRSAAVWLPGLVAPSPVWLGVTASPTAEWIGRQLTEACDWEPAPDYIVRDRDCAYCDGFVRRLRAMGIRDRPTAPRSPWQNAYAERLIGSIRREILDHVGVFS